MRQPMADASCDSTQVLQRVNRVIGRYLRHRVAVPLSAQGLSGMPFAFVPMTQGALSRPPLFLPAGKIDV